MAVADEKLISGISLKFNSQSTKTVKFQFPPHITSDTKTGDWSINDDLHGAEPVAIFKGSKARTISMEWVYIVTGEADWTTTAIHGQVSQLRGYFCGVAKASTLVCTIKLWGMGGDDNFTARIHSLNIAHGKTMIMPGGDPKKAFPLRTTVKLELALWTRGEIQGATGVRKGAMVADTAGASGDMKEALLKLKELKGKISQDWY